MSIGTLALVSVVLTSGCGALGVGLDHSTVARPVAAKLAADSRNAAFSLEAHYGADARTLVLDLREVGAAAPADLWRGLFQSAEALHREGLSFDQVVLQRSGSPVFLMSGKDFATLGAEFADGQNPVYLLRILPEKLERPDGTPAFAKWEGGLLGVTTKQMEDVNAAAKEWAKQP
jgi:hypothetical protein